MRTFPKFRLVPLFLAAALLQALPARAQDPMKEIEELARRVDEQLREVDKLLLESGQKSQTRTKQRESLQKAAESSTTAEASIDELIEKLTKMKDQSSSSQQPPDDGGQSGNKPQNGQQKPDQGQNQRGQQNRRENQTPDYVQQKKEGDGEKPQDGQQQKPQPQPNPQGQQPQGGQEDPATQAENRPGQRQPESETGPGQRGAGEESWGELQPYLNRLKSRGSSPKVPEKYRKYWQAYLKNKAEGSQK